VFASDFKHLIKFYIRFNHLQKKKKKKLLWGVVY